jgi:hypothetical protein
LEFFNNAQSISQTSGTLFAEEPPAKRLRATEKDNTPEHPQQTTKNK